MKLKSLLPLLLVVSGSCVELIEFNGVPIRQYATSVVAFSSQYSPTAWSAAQAIGKQNVYPAYGDINKAWASKIPDESREFLVLGLDTPQTAKTIEIYETFNPGAVDSVFLRKVDSGEWIKVYSKPAIVDLPKEARVFSIFLTEATFLVDAIRIAINEPAIEGWNEIDAVAITGQREE